MTDTRNLKAKAASGMVWTAFQRYSMMIIHFVSDIIIARLLLPQDYGYIGMLAIFMAIANVFIDGGFGSALIQKKNPTHTDYSTVFIFNLSVTAIMYTILYCCGPLIANYYEMPVLCKILRVQGIVLFIHSLNVIQANIIRKNLQFKKLSGIQITAAFISFIVTFIMAYNGYGVWSLVARNYVQATIPCVFYWVTTKWKPTFEFSTKSFKELFGFGFYIFLSHMLMAISKKINGLLIGKIYSASRLGYYSKAELTEHAASDCISSIMTQITYPLYAAAQDNKNKLINMVKQLTSTLAYLTVPIMCVALLVAKPAFILLYTDKWLESVPYFQLLCIAGMASCLQAVNHQVIAAIGKSGVQFTWVVVKQSVGIGLQVLGLFLWGIKGLVICNVISVWFSYFVNISLVSKYVGYKNYQQLIDLAPTFISSGIFAVISYFGGKMLHLSLYPDAIVKATIFVVLYLGWSLIFKPEAYKYTLSILVILKNKTKKK